MTAKDCEEMKKKGISEKAIHTMHGKLIQCSLCEKEYIENCLKQFGYL